MSPIIGSSVTTYQSQPAARYGRFEITELLLQRGADVTAKTVTGKTALSFAKEKGNTQLQELLLDYGAIE